MTREEIRNSILQKKVIAVSKDLMERDITQFSVSISCDDGQIKDVQKIDNK